MSLESLESLLLLESDYVWPALL